MKPVALNSFVAYFLWKRDQIHYRIVVAVKARIEASNLWHIGQSFKHCFNGSKIKWLGVTVLKELVFANQTIPLW
jgi:hypothetical protein